MPDTNRLVSKLDDALAIVRKQRRGACAPAMALGDALRTRFGTNRPFEINVGGAVHTVKPDAVRISKSRIDLGPVELPLMAVIDCHHGDSDDGVPVYGPGIETGDARILPVQVL